MCLPVELRVAAGTPATVHYEWDPETELLAALFESRNESCCTTATHACHTAHDGSAPNSPCQPHVSRPAEEHPLQAARANASVEIEGHDGSWITLDLLDRRIQGLAIAAWPTINTTSAPLPPPSHGHAVASMPPGPSHQSLEIHASLHAEVDLLPGTVHFSLSAAGRSARESYSLQSVHIARDILLEVDRNRLLAGIWLLNVPPHYIPAP